MNNKKYKWGIIATGRIAGLFADGLKFVPQAELFAVASRDAGKANNFAKKYDVPKAYPCYADLYADPDVEIIYVATPHNFHYENTKDALNAGKHVLCEKAFTINAIEAENLVRLARSKQLFLMEAMWNRFQPGIKKAVEIIKAGTLGEIYHMTAELCVRFEYDPKHRIFNPHLGGSSLLDLGVYPIALSSLIMGTPRKIESMAHLAPTGVDDQVSMQFMYDEQKTAQLFCSSRFRSNADTIIFGDKGQLKIHGLIIRPEKLTLTLNGKNPQVIDCPLQGNGYNYEAQAVMDMLNAGELEHPLMPLKETLKIMRIMDLIRKNAGVIYPGEY
jgi:predicted dehydrogenase